MLDAETLRKHLSYDPETGVFRWLSKGRGRVVGAVAGCVSSTGDGREYVKIRVERKLYYAHRLAWLWMHGKWPAKQIDHANGNGLLNSSSNLRESDQTQNLANIDARSTSKSGYKGVTQRGSKWIAQIHFHGVNCYLGIFPDSASAARAYDLAATARFGKFARTNKTLGLL